ncbi:MAG: diacylglycerol kinase [endosymbiont of Galathealinum brachiosum]|uniref:Diacylglycerol kinase n=1 Tax=endosymbiont of Galathealinum brachiosum TaxID=2200906 RepID=A0A370DFH5_9GAMM|nr:MAG: diacylglycerol kinase [endosymbiont of Galathealinum brachiosum]
MADSGNTGLTRIIKAIGFSWQGIKAAYQNEAAFRQELLLATVLIPVAIWLADNVVQMALMISSVLLVMIVEILNSAIEAVVDRFGGELHELSGRAKDMASAAVFLALIYMTVIWCLMLWQIFIQQ